MYHHQLSTTHNKQIQFIHSLMRPPCDLVAVYIVRNVHILVLLYFKGLVSSKVVRGFGSKLCFCLLAAEVEESLTIPLQKITV